MILLEFSEEQQEFHYNDIINGLPKTPENANGWRTLMICTNDYEASCFADFLRVQFLFKRHAKFKELKDTVNNLTNFLSFYKEYVMPKLEKMYS